jgi:hypothetical protein
MAYISHLQIALPFRIPKVLVQMRNVDYIAALAIENADLGIPALVPPPMREKEKHGNAKRKREVGDVCAT